MFDIIHQSSERSLAMHESCCFYTGTMTIVHMKLIAWFNRKPTRSY